MNSVDSYQIGWIAALPIERAAAIAVLDQRHEEPEDFKQHPTDPNSYAWGLIGKHNIVIASLPSGIYGTISATTTATSLLTSLPQIRIGLLVGIAGGIARPRQAQDIRLGDVVVSQPKGKSGGVVQYDMGKAKAGGKWESRDSLSRPPPVLLQALSSLQEEHEIRSSKILDILQDMWRAYPQMSESKGDNPGYVHQGFENDRLFEPAHNHIGGSTCTECDPSWEIERDPRNSTIPKIHYGVIASGNTLVKDAISRDLILEATGEDCVCFEMEAAGIVDTLPCLVIRGICDYADSHKNDRWQRYASATAAAYTKEFLNWVPVRLLLDTPRAINVLQI
ncbi:ankyrin repeat protein [Trichoderma compactum]